MELFNSIKPVLRLPFRTRISTPTTQSIRSLTTTTTNSAAPPRPSASTLSTLSDSLTTVNQTYTRSTTLTNPRALRSSETKHIQERQPWHLHCYATKHNTHLTLTRPNRESVISISAGQIGFKKSARGSYDAAYQLGAYMMARIQRAGLLQQIDDLEFVLRGFGKGREAVTKILTGTEGAVLRNKVVAVTDSTRLKFGGVRSPKPRRLG